ADLIVADGRERRRCRRILERVDLQLAIRQEWNRLGRVMSVAINDHGDSLQRQAAQLRKPARSNTITFKKRFNLSQYLPRIWLQVAQTSVCGFPYEFLSRCASARIKWNPSD